MEIRNEKLLKKLVVFLKQNNALIAFKENYSTKEGYEFRQNKREPNTIFECIESCFEWYQTPQGYNFWRCLWRKCYKSFKEKKQI